jgi:acyl carrier protein
VHQQLESILRTLLRNDDFVLRDDIVPETVPGWDSLVQVNLMFALEEQCGVRFTGNQIFEFRTVGELRHFLEKNAR